MSHSGAALKALVPRLRALVQAADAAAQVWTQLDPALQKILGRLLNLPCTCKNPFAKVEMLRGWLQGLEDFIKGRGAHGDGPSPSRTRR